MLRSIFSTDNWMLATTIFSIVYAFFLMSQSRSQLIKGNKVHLFAWLAVIFVTLYIGTRPITCYADTALYTDMYDLVKRGVWDSVRGEDREPFWAFVQYQSMPFLDASGWLTVVAIFYIGGMSLAARRWFPQHFMIAIVFLFTAYSFWGYGTNGIRHGMATSTAMFALTFLTGNKRELAIGYALLIVACLTHKSCIIVFAAATLARFYNNININILIWGACILLSLLFAEPLKELVAGLISDDRASNYILNMDASNSVFNRSGFRWDFILYSSIPILIGWYAVSKAKIQDDVYLFILSTYIFANCAWCLINSVAYSNRFAYLSWFIYPILIVYPFVKFKLHPSQGAILGGFLLFFIGFNWLF